MAEKRKCLHCGKERHGWVMNSDGSGFCPACYKLCERGECSVVEQKNDMPDFIQDLFGKRER